MRRAQRLYGFHTALIYLSQKSLIVFAFISVDFSPLKKEGTTIYFFLQMCVITLISKF